MTETLKLNRIKVLREAMNYSQQKLAAALNISYASEQRYEYGQRDIPGDVLIRMTKLFDVSSDYILGVTDDPAIADKKNGFVPVPLYGTVAAGVPIEMLQVDDMKEAPARFVDDDPNAYLVRVNGTSMNRVIHDRSFALVSPKYTEPNEHDMFLVTVNGYDATIKHVHKLANGIELIPDSYDPTHRPQIYDFGEDDTPKIKVLGKVVWWCAEF